MLLLTLADLTVLPIAATAVCASVHMPALIGTALSAFKIELLLDMPTLADVFSGNISSWRDERIRPAQSLLPPPESFRFRSTCASLPLVFGRSSFACYPRRVREKHGDFVCNTAHCACVLQAPQPQRRRAAA